MMRTSLPSRRFSRARYVLPYRRKIYVIPEGEKTEEAYLRHVQRVLDIRTCNLVFDRSDGSIQSLIKCAERNEGKIKSGIEGCHLDCTRS